MTLYTLADISAILHSILTLSHRFGSSCIQKSSPRAAPQRKPVVSKALIAQLGERQTEDLEVSSSILLQGTRFFSQLIPFRSSLFTDQSDMPHSPFCSALLDPNSYAPARYQLHTVGPFSFTLLPR